MRDWDCSRRTGDLFKGTPSRNADGEITLSRKTTLLLQMNYCHFKDCFSITARLSRTRFIFERNVYGTGNQSGDYFDDNKR